MRNRETVIQRQTDRETQIWRETESKRDRQREREMKSDTLANLSALFSSRRREKAPAVPRTVADRWGQQEGDLEGPRCQAVPAGEREREREAPDKTTPWEREREMEEKRTD